MEAAIEARTSSARRGAYVRAAIVLFAVVALDQLTKQLVRSSIAPGEVRRLIPGLELVHWTNSGVAFSALAGGGAVVYVLTAAALVALIAFLRARPERRWLWLPTGMLLGGAIGNLIDRIRLGAVTDFIKLPHWPAFNVADVSITLGVVALVLVLELGGRASKRRS